ncbi:MAG: DUF2306 domain-containing protein [Planctomycetaceae bacterium]
MNDVSSLLKRMWVVLAVLLVLRTVIVVFASYQDYLPPNFDSAFLAGRESYFFGFYRWPFYLHITSGPCSLLIGLVLLNNQLRTARPALHRVLGNLQCVCVIGVVAPSGLSMSWHSDGGAAAGTAFALLAVLTALTAAIGWREAVRRRFVSHRRWMWRNFVLLCSAVVLRVIGGTQQVAGIESEWGYPTAAWVCWLLPLLILESIEHRNQVRIGK